MSRDVIPRKPKFENEVLRFIAGGISACNTNSSIDNLFIDVGYSELIEAPSGVSKAERLYIMLRRLSASRLMLGDEKVMQIIVKFLDPIRFTGNENIRIHLLNQINRAILRMGIQIDETGKVLRTNRPVQYFGNEDSKDKENVSLGDLITKCNQAGIAIDNDWIASIAALNIMEAALNKKLEGFGDQIEGDFTKKLDRVVLLIKQKEKRKIQRMLPESLYKGPRNKLDHASHKYAPTPTETKNIIKNVTDFLNDLFPS